MTPIFISIGFAVFGLLLASVCLSMRVEDLEKRIEKLEEKDQ